MADQAGAQGAENGASGQGGAQPWTAGLPEDMRGYVELKQWKDPAAAVESYRNLEKLQRTPRERLLTIPEKEDSPEWGEFYGRLGRPGKPEEYGIDGADPELLADIHEAGLSKSQAQKLATKLAARAAAQQGQLREASEQELQAQDLQLRQEWGQEYANNLQRAKTVVARAAKAAGIGDEDRLGDLLDTMQDAIHAKLGKGGYTTTMKFFAWLGRNMGEAGFVEGENGRGGDFGMTPAAARAAFDAFRTDREKMAKVAAGDRGAMAEFERLSELAAQGQTFGGPPRAA